MALHHAFQDDRFFAIRIGHARIRTAQCLPVINPATGVAFAK